MWHRILKLLLCHKYIYSYILCFHMHTYIVQQHIYIYIYTNLLTFLIPLLRVYPSLLHAASASSVPKLLPHTPPHTSKKFNCNLPSDRCTPPISLTPPLNWKAGVPAIYNKDRGKYMQLVSYFNTYTPNHTVIALNP